MRFSSVAAAAALAPLAAHAWKTYVVPHTPGADDTPALMAALKSGNYSTNATILFQKGTTYNIFTSINFPKFANGASAFATLSSRCSQCAKSRSRSKATSRTRTTSPLSRTSSARRCVFCSLARSLASSPRV
jgi:hypothetical protein